MGDLKESLERELEDLKQAKQDLLDNLEEGKIEAKDMWASLEKQWPKVEETVKEIESEGRVATKQLTDAAKDVIADLKRGYEELKKSL